MKVLFIGANPEREPSLNLEREATDLQRLFLSVLGEEVSFTSLPGLRLEEIPSAIARCSPDILHISAHNDEGLCFANQLGQPTLVSGEAMTSFLSIERPPRLVYLNACNSCELAPPIAKVTPMVIGTTAPITNLAARASALLFYENILSGYSAHHSFTVSNKMLEALQHQRASSELFLRDGADATREVLYRPLRIIADFVREDAKPSKDGEFDIRFGLMGCPADTTQVIFFTDDKDFIQEDDDDEEDLSSLCEIVRGSPVRGMVWVDEEDSWELYGDFRLFAVCATGGHHAFSVAAMLCDAIETKYRLLNGEAPPRHVAQAVATLRGADGSELDKPPPRRNKPRG
ncbi:MAG TPA: hypothetical protein VKR31_12395 [Rhizomicrobium sp.]|nr:hypothetical protein [Rhizomicrobium sp.]